MKIKGSMIDKDLRRTGRRTGRMIKIINNTFTEKRLRLFGKFKVTSPPMIHAFQQCRPFM